MFKSHLLRIQLNERIQNFPYHLIELGNKKIRIRLFLQEQQNLQTSIEQVR